MPVVDLESSVLAVMQAAIEAYEADPVNGVHGQPFIFTVSEGGIIAHPVALKVDPIALQIASHYGPKAMEQMMLEAIRSRAGTVPPLALEAVGYLFPARGDFPQSDTDVVNASWLRGIHADTTPWEKEGLVMVVDTLEGRQNYAALREIGEVAGPLSEPQAMMVFTGHVPRLFPYCKHQLTPIGGFC